MLPKNLTEKTEQEKMGDLQAMSVLSNYQDNLSQEMNTDRIVMGGIHNNPSLTFNDGVRSIDFVLVWESLKEDATSPEAYEQRRIFEHNLEQDGLQLEREAPEGLHGLHFVKIHAPVQVLRDYSEILKLRMPMKECSKIRKVAGRMPY
ncbi:anoctamin-5-like isoform X4 [Manduca sexta]|uniref:anoctamin-5-like isoform X4 n=1 Tax=Manduca sexta TaxID=7130 RepID=UPI00188E5895|nr:anoctamin-5-like isoform X4 [Manduca sexta]